MDTTEAAALDAERVAFRRWVSFANGTLVHAVAMGVSTGVIWACLFMAHAFDRRVPTLNVYAIFCLVFAVSATATWLRWAILSTARDT